MTTMVSHSGRFAVRFWHLFGFAHHGKAWRRRPLPAFAPSGRFSAWFGRRSRCAKLGQNGGHDATNLSRSCGTRASFPGTQHHLSALLEQEQLITSAGDDPTPAFKLLRGAQTGLLPKQVLFEKAVAMFLREAPLVPRRHLLQRDVLVTDPHKPAFARIAFGVACRLALHADDTDLQLGPLAEVQVFPARDDHALASLIGPFPDRIGRTMRFGPRALKERPMFARRTALAGHAGGSGAIELAVAFEADESRQSQVAAGAHEG